MISELNRYSFKNKDNLKKSKKCGCYYCFHIFYPKEIIDWVDNSETALCPKCNIDSVIGDFNINFDIDFLKNAKKYWF